MNKEFLDLAEQLKSSVSCTVRLNELMSGHTSFKIGGPADILVLPESIEQLREVLKVVKETVCSSYFTWQWIKCFSAR